MCLRCDGSGLIVVCIDDMCRGVGECIHGPDGMEMCPDCAKRDNEDPPDEWDEENEQEASFYK